MAFHLKNQKAKLVHVNLRSEVQGSDRVAAVDLKFSINVGAASLDGFSPELRGFLFHKKGGGDLADSVHDAPDLRFERLGPYPWSGQIVGGELTVHYGTGGKSDFKLASINVSKFLLDPQQGGTTIVSFRVQAHPDPAQIGKLSGLMQCETEISITGPDFSDDKKEEEEE